MQTPSVSAAKGRRSGPHNLKVVGSNPTPATIENAAKLLKINNLAAFVLLARMARYIVGNLLGITRNQSPDHSRPRTGRKESVVPWRRPALWTASGSAGLPRLVHLDPQALHAAKDNTVPVSGLGRSPAYAAVDTCSESNIDAALRRRTSGGLRRRHLGADVRPFRHQSPPAEMAQTGVARQGGLRPAIGLTESDLRRRQLGITIPRRPSSPFTDRATTR